MNTNGICFSKLKYGLAELGIGIRVLSSSDIERMQRAQKDAKSKKAKRKKNEGVRRKRNQLKIINAGGQKTSNRNMLRDILTIFLDEEAHWKLWSGNDKEPDSERIHHLAKEDRGLHLCKTRHNPPCTTMPFITFKTCDSRTAFSTPCYEEITPALHTEMLPA